MYELPFGYLRACIYVRAPVPPNLRSSYVYTSFPTVIWELVYAYELPFRVSESSYICTSSFAHEITARTYIRAHLRMKSQLVHIYEHPARLIRVLVYMYELIHL